MENNEKKLKLKIYCYECNKFLFKFKLFHNSKIELKNYICEKCFKPKNKKMIIQKPKYEIIKARYHKEQSTLLYFNLVCCCCCGETIQKSHDLFKRGNEYFCRECIKKK